MSQLILQLQSYRLKLAVFLLFMSFGTLCEVLGPVTTLDKLISLDQRNFSETVLNAKKNRISLHQMKNKEDYLLAPAQLQSILLHSPTSYTGALATNRCDLFPLLKNNLLRDTTGEIKELVIYPQSGTLLTDLAIVSKDDFLKYFWPKSCPKNEELDELFKNKNLKSTLSKVSFVKPSDKRECIDFLAKFRKNPYWPYLCSIKRDLDIGRKSQQILEFQNKKKSISQKRLESAVERYNTLSLIIPPANYSELSSLCNHLDNEESYCVSDSTGSKWPSLLQDSDKSKTVSQICTILGYQKTSECLYQIEIQPNLCNYKNASAIGGLTPRFDCNELSQLLSDDQLYTGYPAQLNLSSSPSLENLSRLVSHFKKSDAEFNPLDNQNFSALYSLYKLIGKEENWPLKLCTYDPFQENTELCLPYVPGDSSTLSVSETRIVERLLKKKVPTASQAKCQIIKAKSYNPTFLKYKYGCFILEADSCIGSNCMKKIIFNEATVKEITYKGELRIEYFKTSYANTRYALHTLLVDTLKLKSQSLKNLNEIVTFLSKNSRNVAHGVGCKEDLLPYLTTRLALNQCTPLPFIISGIVKSSTETKVLVHLSIDALYFPRVISARDLFQSTASYKRLFPINQEMIYGLSQ